LRAWLPQWHRAEKEFRDWYLGLVDRFEAEDETAYQLWIRILNCPEAVRGYREVRRPAMDDARQKVAQWLSELQRTPRPSAKPAKASLSS
jgi:hypothetical protein